jgi:hypothetical protein
MPVGYMRPTHLAQSSTTGADLFKCRADDRLFKEDIIASKRCYAAESAKPRMSEEQAERARLARFVATPTSTALQEALNSAQLTAAEARASEANSPIGIIGGGVSGVFAALTLRSLGCAHFRRAPGSTCRLLVPHTRCTPQERSERGRQLLSCRLPFFYV